MAEEQQSNNGANRRIGFDPRDRHIVDFGINRDVNLMREGSAAQRSDEEILSKSVGRLGVKRATTAEAQAFRGVNPTERLNAKRATIAAEVQAPTRKLQAFTEAKYIATREFSDQYDNVLAKIISERKMFDGTTFVNGKQYIAKHKAAFMQTVKAKLDSQTLDMERQYVANAYASVIPDENGNYAQPDHVNVAFVKSFNVLAQQMTEDELEEWLCRIDAFAKAANSLDNSEGESYSEAVEELEKRKDERDVDYVNAVAYRYRLAYKMNDGTFFEGSEKDLADLLYCEALQLDFKSLAGIEKATQIMTAAKFLSFESQRRVKDAIGRQLRFANEATPEQKVAADAKKSFVNGKLKELDINPDDADNASLVAELLLGLEASTMSRADWDGYVESMARTYNIRKTNALNKKAFSARITGIGMQRGEEDEDYKFLRTRAIRKIRAANKNLFKGHTAESVFRDYGHAMSLFNRVVSSQRNRAVDWIKENVIYGHILDKVNEDGTSE